MRYSVFGFSQEKLVEYGLDVSDALILDWFQGFFTTGMQKRDINGKIFGWVKYSAIIHDLPVLNISSERAIQNRFENYVHKGLLEKDFSFSQMGKRTWFATTPRFEELFNSQVNQTSVAQANQTSVAQANQTSVAQANQTSVAQANQTSVAQANQTSVAQANQTSLALNNSLTNNSLTNNSLTNNSLTRKKFPPTPQNSPVTDSDNREQKGGGENFEIIKNAQEKVFQNFDEYFLQENFTQELVEFCKNQNIAVNDAEKYLTMTLKNYQAAAKTMKILFPRQFFRKMIFSDQTLKNYFETKESAEKAEEKQTCPVCGKIASRWNICGFCNFDMMQIDDRNAVLRSRQLYNLSPEQKAALKKDEENYNRMLQNYGMKAYFDPDIKLHLQNVLSRIYAKYGIA
jgi:hypothetical protein